MQVELRLLHQCREKWNSFDFIIQRQQKSTNDIQIAFNETIYISKELTPLTLNVIPLYVRFKELYKTSCKSVFNISIRNLTYLIDNKYFS